MDEGQEDLTLTQPSAPAGPYVGGRVAERFTIVRRLGEGGMAVVYEAIDTKLGEKRALKFSKSGHAHSIPPEARAALRVTHENVCRAFEIHSTETQNGPADFISMEYVEGETLAMRWRREALSQAEALEIARQLCLGVEAAHQAQVLHLDLKSGNVMLGRTAAGGLRVIVMDFGLAQAFGDTSQRFGGTPNYIAPERYLGAEATPACDIYALGVILYEMLAGRLPFPGEPDLQKRLYELPEPPSKRATRPMDARWDAIVLRCLEPNPAKRTATAAAVLAELDRVFTPSHRRRWLAGAAAGAVLATGLFAFRERIWPEPPLARLAVLPFAGSTGDKALDGTLQGGLSEISGRLESLGAASRRLVLIRPEEAARYQVDSAEKAGGQLGATHVLQGTVKAQGKLVAIHAEVRAVASGDVLRQYDGEFAAGELAGVSTSLTGVVTSAFRLGKALPANIKPEAYPFYAFGLGLMEKDRTNYDRALAQYETALEFDGASPLIPAAQAKAFLRKFAATHDERWLREAAKAARNAERLNPDSPAVLEALGEVEREEGRPEKALDYLNRAVALEPNKFSAWQQLGLALAKMGKDQEAVAALRKAIELAPGFFSPHQSLGSIHFQKGRYTEAIDEFRKLTELAPTLPVGHAILGAAFLAAEREAEAEQALRRSLQLREMPTALNNLGVLMRYQHRDSEASEIFSRVLRQDAGSITLRLNLGNALKSAGRPAEARTHFEKAGELARAMLLRDPRDAAARAQLAYVQTQTGGRETALDNALQAARLEPNVYAVLFWVTMTMEALGKRELSVPLLREATQQQLRDLRRQPDLQAFVRDPKYQSIFQGKKKD